MTYCLNIRVDCILKKKRQRRNLFNIFLAYSKINRLWSSLVISLPFTRNLLNRRSHGHVRYCWSRWFASARIVSRGVSLCLLQADYNATSWLLSRRATRIKSRTAARGYLRCILLSHATAKEKSQERERERGRRREKEREREHTNNRRADRTDEWVTTTKDIVRSIDGIVVCNVNWLSSEEPTDGDERIVDSTCREKLFYGNETLKMRFLREVFTVNRD